MPVLLYICGGGRHCVALLKMCGVVFFCGVTLNLCRISVYLCSVTVYLCVVPVGLHRGILVVIYTLIISVSNTGKSVRYGHQDSD